MALKVFDGTNWDTALLGTETISTANINLTTAFQASIGQTAPNLTNKITGVFFFCAGVPSTGNIEIEVRESGVSKVSGVCNNADIQLGWNYLRFTTPYQFATLAAGAYVAYIRKSVANSGVVARSATGVLPVLLMTYDTATTLGVNDVPYWMGFHNSGMTPKVHNLTGTSNEWGNYGDRTITSATTRTLDTAVIGNGASVVWDTASDCKAKSKCSIIVTRGGLLDMRPGASSISTLEFDSGTADGDHGILIPSSGIGGQVLTTGATVTVAPTYVSGVGTAANPVITSLAHGLKVNDELVFGWGANYQQNEIRYVKSIPGANQLILSTTPGGAEAALTHTHATLRPIGNLTRNSIIKSTTNTRGFWLFNNQTAGAISDFGFTRFEFPNCLSGKALNPSSTSNAVNFNGSVLYNNSASGRGSVNWNGAIEETIQDVILYNTRGTNFSAQSGFCLAGASKKTIRNLYLYAEPNSTTCCAALSIAASSTSNRVVGLYSSGANAGNAGAGYAVGIYGNGNTIEDAIIDGSRQKGLVLDAGLKNQIINSLFGQTASNTIDVDITSGVFVQALFDTCSFASATLLNNYLNSLDGSLVSFQNLDTNTSKHRWYTNKGSFWSSGSGLADTTVRTPASLSLAIKPENNTTGAELIFKVPANPQSQLPVFGYLYRNAAFSSGTLKVELFLPGTLLTDTPDATVTLDTTTNEWLPWFLSAYYEGTVPRYARIRVTAVSSTVGAYAFLDDIFDAQTGNKVAGLDLWDEGQISPILVAADYSSIPNQTTLLVESALEPYFDAIPSAEEIAAAVAEELVVAFEDIPTEAEIAAAIEAILADNFAAIPTNPLLDDDARLDALADISTLPSAQDNAQAVWSDDTDYPEPQKGGLLEKTRKLAKQIRDNVI